jgi:nucleotide-binding universal stress UspA family protein
MFTTIIAGTDADKGRGAVAVAARLAEATGAGLVLAAVRPDPLVDVPAIHVGATTAARRELEHALREVRDELAPAARVVVQPAVSVAHGLRVVAHREHAGLIAVGVSHRSRARRLLEGDHAMQVMHGAPTAVLLVPEPDEPPARAPEAAPRFRTVVAGVDDSHEAAAALRLAADLARACGASLRLVRVVEDRPPSTVAGGYGAVIDWEAVVRDQVEGAKRELAGAAARCGVPGATTEVLVGWPSDRLVAAAEEADVLVLGSRRWGPLHRLAVGSTTASVAHHAHCPILVPPRGAEEPAAEPHEEVGASSSGHRDRRPADDVT